MNKNIRISKSIYNNTQEGIQTQINVRYNTHTNYIGIYTQFKKSRGFVSGIVNNKTCATYLGITVAEQVLFNIFNNVERMPNNNQGFDFKCNQGYMIDVKAATKKKNRNSWFFNINKNPIADYFLCLAFDDRKNLNPMHIWLIPSKRINNLIGLMISEATLNKWSKFELTDKLAKVIGCCNIMKGDK